MKVNAVNIQPTTRKNNKYKAAKTGAALTAGVLTASTAISWVSRPKDMMQVVNNCGGKGKYAANFVIGMALLSGIGALANTVFSKIAEKIQPKQPPKAAN